MDEKVTKRLMELAGPGTIADLDQITMIWRSVIDDFTREEALVVGMLQGARVALSCMIEAQEDENVHAATLATVYAFGEQVMGGTAALVELIDRANEELR